MHPPSDTVGPRGTVTFVFTDIEGSTRLLQQVGAAYPRVLEDQRSLVRRGFEEHEGYLVDTAGDGFFFAFERARDAVSAAVAAQRLLATHPWPGEAVVRVRMGLHTGEPIASGSGYVGLDVHRAARIAASAHGGQVVVSETTRQLVANDLPAGVSLLDLGQHALKDFPQPQHLYQIVAAGLGQTFPPLRGVGRAPSTNLPARAVRLIGRDDDLSELESLLRRDDVRLLTLTGAGGTGKTSLAIEAASRCSGQFRDGVVYVALAPVVDPALVVAAIAQTLAVSAHAEQPIFDAVIEHLRERRVLLVLDNFEHLVSAAERVALLTSACADTKVLVTSRFALRLSMEREFPVAPLRTPDPARSESSSAMSAYPAVQLFAQRAAAHKPGIRLDDEESAYAIAEICRRLDGLPLAIELAAARIKLFSPRALLARLDRRLDLLGGGARDLPSRHRTLRQAIGWSFDLLEPGEQAVFRRLSVFAGGCTLESAEAVCAAAGDPGITTFDAVAALVDKSLLRQDADEDGEPRFGMLETVREYALEQLAASGEEAITRAAHADVAIAIAETHEPALTGAGQPEALRRMSREHDNLRTGFDWTIRARESARALQLGAALCRFWIIRGFHTEGRQRLRAALELPANPPDAAVRARVLSGLSVLAYEQGDLTEATRHLEEALRCYRETGDERRVAESLNHLGWVAFFGADAQRGRELTTEAMAIHEKRADMRGLALSFTNLGSIELHCGSTAAAHDFYTRALELRRQLNDARGIAYGEINLAWALIRLGQVDEAVALCESAEHALRSLDDRQILAFARYMLGEAALERNAIAEAVAVMEDAVALGREIMQGASLGIALAGLTEALARSGDHSRASVVGREAESLHTRGGTQVWLMRSLCSQGDALRLGGRMNDAAQCFLDGLRIAHARGLDFYASEHLAGMAGVASKLGRHELTLRLDAASSTLRARAAASPSRRHREAARVAADAAEVVAGEAASRARDEGARMGLAGVIALIEREMPAPQ